MHRRSTAFTSSLNQAIAGLTFALAVLTGRAVVAQGPLQQLTHLAEPDPTTFTETPLLLATVVPARHSVNLGILETASPLPLNGPVDPSPARRAGDCWTWQVLPDGLIYHSYMAGVRESRFAAQWVYERDQGWIWDIALGGRVGVLRYGNDDPIRPEGWQIDIEGAGMPRLNLEESMDLMATDYRFGVPITYGRGRHQAKLAFYHLSSHLGDELMIKHPGVPRINYSRNVLMWGHSYYWTENVRLYGEAGWGFVVDGGSEPWEFQFGIDYRPGGPTGLRGAPFIAINAHLRQEVDFGGNVSVQTGWLWRGPTGHMFRLGMQYFAGKSEQFEFFNEYEEKLGLGVWYDY